MSESFLDLQEQEIHHFTQKKQEENPIKAHHQTAWNQQLGENVTSDQRLGVVMCALDPKSWEIHRDRMTSGFLLEVQSRRPLYL